MCCYVPSNKVVNMFMCATVCLVIKFTACCKEALIVNVGFNPLMILNYQNNALFDVRILIPSARVFKTN